MSEPAIAQPIQRLAEKESIKDVIYDQTSRTWICTGKGKITKFVKTNDSWQEIPTILKTNQHKGGVYLAPNVSGMASFSLRFEHGENYQVSPSGQKAMALTQNAKMMTTLDLTRKRDIAWTVICHQLGSSAEFGIYCGDEDSKSEPIEIKLNGPGEIDFFYDYLQKTVVCSYGETKTVGDFESLEYISNATQLKFFIQAKKQGQEFTIVQRACKTFETGPINFPDTPRWRYCIFIDHDEELKKQFNEFRANAGEEILQIILEEDGYIFYKLNRHELINSKLIQPTPENLMLFGKIETLTSNVENEYTFKNTSLLNESILEYLTMNEEIKNNRLRKIIERVKECTSKKDIEAYSVKFTQSANLLKEQTFKDEIYAHGEVAMESTAAPKMIFIENSDKVLVYDKQQAKLISRLEGEFNFDPFLLQQASASIEDEISLNFSRNEAVFLAEKITWDKILIVASFNENLGDIPSVIERFRASIEDCQGANQISIFAKPKPALFFLALLYGEVIRALSSCSSTCEKLLAETTVEKMESPTENTDENVFGMIFEQEENTKPPCVDQKKKTQIKSIGVSEAAYGLAIIFRLYEGILANLGHLGLGDSEVARYYTAFGRLLTFIEGSNPDTSIIELAELGLIQDIEPSEVLSHFANPSIKISGFSQQPLTHGEIFAILKGNNCNLKSIVNIPLGETLNNLPALSFSSKITSVSAVPNSPKLIIVLESGEVYLYDSSLAMCMLYGASLRTHQKIGQRINNLVKAKYNFTKLTGEIADELLNIEDEQEINTQSEGEESSGNEPAEVDHLKLNYLYQMGFPIELAKKALRKCKNDSIDAAIDLISVMQEKINKKKATNPLVETISLLKPQWNCNACTFLNEDSADGAQSEPVCMICYNPAPPEAYYTREEILQMEEDKKKIIDAEIQEEEEKRNKAKQSDKEAETVIIPEEVTSGDISAVRNFSLRQNLFDRHFIVAAFNHGSNSLLKIRRLGYDEEYIKELVWDQRTVEISSLSLCNYPIGLETSEADISKGLRGKNIELRIDNLIPIINKNSKVLVLRHEHDERRTDESILQIIPDFEVSEKEDREYITFKVLVRREGKIFLETLEISATIQSFSDASFELKSFGSKLVSEKGNKVSLIDSSYLMIDGKIIKVSSSESGLDITDVHQTEDSQHDKIESIKIGDGQLILMWKDNLIQSIPLVGSAKPIVSIVKHSDAPQYESLHCDKVAEYFKRRENVRFGSLSTEGINRLHIGHRTSRMSYQEIFKVGISQGKITLHPEEMMGCGLVRVCFYIDPSSKQWAEIAATSIEAQSDAKQTAGIIGFESLGANKKERMIPLRTIHKSMQDLNKVMNFGAALYDKKMYWCSQKSKDNQQIIVLENLHEQNMRVTNLIVEFRKPEQESYRCDVLCFTVNNIGRIDPSKYCKFKSKEDFEQWASKKKQSLEKWTEDEPVSFLENISAGEEIKCSLRHLRKARYIVLLVLNRAPEDLKLSHNIKFIGAIGSLSPPGRHQNQIESELEEKGTYTLDATASIAVNQKYISKNKPIKYSRKGFRAEAVYNMEFLDSAKEISIEFEGNTNNEISFIQVELMDRSFEGNTLLKTVIESKVKLVEFVQQKVRDLGHPSTDSQTKLEILNMCVQLIENYDGSIIKDICEAIDAFDLIKYSILYAEDSSVLMALELLFEKLNQYSDFIAKIIDAMNKVLDDIENLETSPFGLESFFKMLKFYLSLIPEDMKTDNIGQVILRAAEKMNQLDLSVVKTLNELHISYNPFDSYSILALRKEEAEKEESNDFILIDGLKEIENSIVARRRQNTIEVALDLLGECSISGIIIQCEEFKKPICCTKMIVEVFKRESHEDVIGVLLSKKVYDESTILYLNKIARDTDLCFLNQNYLNSIGLSMKNLVARHLRIMVTFTNRYVEHIAIPRKHKILPLIVGKRLVEKREQAILPVYIDSDNEVIFKPSQQKESQVETHQESKTTEDVNDEMLTVLKAMLNDHFVQLETEEDEAKKVEVRKSITDICLNIKNGLLAKRNFKGLAGKDSINFWEIVVYNLGDIIKSDKVNISVQFDMNHIESLFENIILESSDEKSQLRLAVTRLIETDLLSSDEKALKSKVFNLIKHLSTPEKIVTTIAKDGITKLVRILDKVPTLTLTLFVKHLMKNVCRKYESNRILSILQMHNLLSILKFFADHVKNQKKVVNEDLITQFLQVSLWILEQKDLNEFDKKNLFNESIKITGILLRKNMSMLINFKLEKQYIEALLVRTLSINAFEELETIFEYFAMTKKDSKCVDNQKNILEVICKVLTDYHTFVKGDSVEDNTIKLALEDSQISTDTSIVFLTFLSKYANKMADLIRKNEPEKKVLPEADESKHPNRVANKQNMSYEQVSIHRSLSLSSQTRSKEDEIIPSKLIDNILKLTEEMFIENPYSINFLMEISKFVFSKGFSKKSLLKFLQLLNQLDLPNQTLLMTRVASGFIEQYKALSAAERTDQTFKHYCSSILEGLMEIIKKLGGDIRLLSTEYFKFTSTILEVIILGGQLRIPKVSFAAISSEISVSTIKNLFIMASEQILKIASFGGSEGFDSLEKEHIKYLELMDMILAIITKTSMKDNKEIVLAEAFSNIKGGSIDQIDAALGRFIEWTMLNEGGQVNSDSPAQILLNQLCQSVTEIFTIGAKNHEIGKLMIKNVMRMTKNADEHINQSIRDKKIGFAAGIYLDGVFNCLEKILTLTLVDEHMANYFVIECQGFEFILDRLTYNTAKKVAELAPSTQVESILKQLLSKDTPSSTGGKSKTNTESELKIEEQKTKIKHNTPRGNNTSSIFRSEFATDLTLLPGANQKGEKIKDWSKYKKGSCRYMLNHSMKKESWHELVLCFEVPKKIDFRTIKVGFLSQWQEYSEKIVAEPSYVHLHYRDGQNWKYICELDRYEDNGYNLSSVVIFQKNFLRISGDNFEEALGCATFPKEIKIFRLVIGRPYVSFQENYSILKTKNFSNISLGLSYISLLGVESKEYDVEEINGYIRENQLMKIFNTFFSMNFKAIDKLSNIESFIDKVKPIFDKIVESYITQFTPALISFSKNNDELGMWILKKLMKRESPSTYAILVGEIILSNPSQFRKRLTALFEFVLGEFKLIGSKNKDSSVFNFMGIFSACIYKAPAELEENDPFYKLACNDNTFETIIKAFKAFPDIQQIKKFVITFLTIPEPIFIVDFENPSKHLVNLLIKHIDEGSMELCESLSIIALSDKKHCEAVQSSDVVSKILRSLENFEKPEFKHALKFVTNFMNYDAFFDRFVEEESYEKLFFSVKDIIQNSKDETLRNESVHKAINAIKMLITNKADPCAKRFAEILMEECNKASTYGDDFGIFLQSCFLPMINSMKTYPITFKSLSQTGKNNAPEMLPGVESSEPKKLDSKLILKKHLEVLYKNASTILDSSTYEKFKNGSWELAFQTEYDSYDYTNLVREKLMGKGPFMILIDGEATGLKTVLGVFCAKPMPVNMDNEVEVHINNCDNHFLFLYEREDKQNTYHYRMNPLDEKFFKFTNKESSEKGFVISESGMEKIYLSSIEGPGSHIDLYPMKCLKTDINPKYEFPYDFHIRSGFEVWVLNETSGAGDNSHKSNNFNIDLVQEDNEFVNLSYSFFKDTLVFNIPSKMTVQGIKEVLFNLEDTASKEKTENKKLEFKNEDGTIFEDELTIEEIEKSITRDERVLSLRFEGDWTIKDYSKITSSSFNDRCMPEMALLNQFSTLGGIELLLKQCQELINEGVSWKDHKFKEQWKVVISELIFFSKIKNFSSNFIVREHSLEVLMTIFAEMKQPESWWSSKEELIFTNIYKSVGSIFELDHSKEIRANLISDGILSMLFERLQNISKETVRKFEQITHQQEVAPTEPEKTEKEGEQEDDEDDFGNKKLEKRKGVGYDNGGSKSTWSTQDYLQLKDKKNIRIMMIVNILKNILSCPDWSVEEDLLHLFSESCIFSLIENSFRCSSLLEMAKEKDLYTHYLRFTQKMSSVNALVPGLMHLDPQYKPSQIESIHSLLSKLANSAALFRKIGSEGKGGDKTAEDAFELADIIIEVNEVVDNIVSASDLYKQQMKDEAMNYKELPMDEAYRLLLKDQRFGYISMKEPNGEYVHHWKSSFTEKTQSEPKKMVRLAQEIADLSSSLPIDCTNAMFVRADEDRLDVMRAIIFGAEGTPYAHGAFEYDIFCIPGYPDGPPKVNLQTTGNQDVRFNPNLYANGKVCLSLLGTWRGNASENWDPNLSNLNQVLMSIQAVVMSEEVYFNEPGYEHEAGTQAGESKNLAYSNIVRLCNMKYAMTGHLKNPPQGFEAIIKTHFYLKRDVIKKDIKKWRKMAEGGEPVYKQLVLDHNYNYANRYQNNPEEYLVDFDKAAKELEDALDELGEPPIDALLGSKLQHKTKKVKQEKVDIKKDILDLNEIDVAFDDDAKQGLQGISIEDSGVKDRWSRYIGAMGIEAVKKQAEAAVLISGIDTLGIEIAKNIVLSGVKRLTLHDNINSSLNDLSGQFFITEADVKSSRNRAEASRSKIQQLNYYVKVDTVLEESTLPTELAKAKELYEDYNVVILVGKTKEEITTASLALREQKDKKLIIADCRGVFSRVFCDYGSSFLVFDKNGEEPQEVMIKNIEPVVVDGEKRAKITLLEGVKSTYEDGDTIKLDKVEGMQLLKQDITEDNNDNDDAATSVNGHLYKIKTIKVDEFYLVGDFELFTPYIRGGIAKLVKIPQKLEFKPYHEIYHSSKPGFEENLMIHDFMKFGHAQIIHLAFVALEEWQTNKSGAIPTPYSLADAKEFVELCKKITTDQETYKELVDFSDENTSKKATQLLAKFAMTLGGNFAPQSAYIGGFVAQEVVKSITGKFMPTFQLFYSDSIEVLVEQAFPDDLLSLEADKHSELIHQIGVTSKSDRYDGLRLIVGQKLLDQIHYTNLFMVGSGAIGCELLKNYAMIGVGVGKAIGEKQAGSIILTDPDIIEVSNLNRQFLFREKHLRKPKSLTAAAVAKMMNPDLEGNIFARLDKLCDATSNIYTDEFFIGLDIVTNALDNVAARRYIDSRCVTARTPLIESGTLGPKGHVQVIIPNKTESYGSMEDPAEENEIPHCTLKMFPEETLHCVEWARDLFGMYFTQRPKALKKCLEMLEAGEEISVQDAKALRDAVHQAKEAPTTFNDCIIFAVHRFKKYFHNDIKQLLCVYPLDHKDKEGNPFWRLPKRPPTHLDFNADDELHMQFVLAMANLWATSFGLEVSKEHLKLPESKAEYIEFAKNIRLPEFVPDESKAKEIAQDNEKAEKKQAKETEEVEEIEEAEEPGLGNDYSSLLAALKKIQTSVKSKDIHPDEFEKDDDNNHHIDLIHSMSNLRARNYSLDPMDWITVKIKAGRIVPALATTTAAISGLQTLEYIKILKNIDVEHMKNAFLNLAVPILTQTEPGAVPKLKIKEGLEVSIWDRWEFKDCSEKTLQDLFKLMEEQYKIYPKDVIQGAKPIYLKSLGDNKALSQKISELFDGQKGDYEDLTITCTLEKGATDVIQGLPPVRLYF